MHAYGHTRRDKLECSFGCCTTKSGKMRSGRHVIDKAARKTARQLMKQRINASLLTDEEFLDSLEPAE